MFIVIESIDGGGCQTQAELLHQSISGSTYLKFPHYNTPVGRMIKEFLYDEKKLNAKEQFLLYTMQFIFDTPEIREKSRRGTVVADRFFTTTLCYQTLEGISEKVALRFAGDFEIMVPDVIFFLDVKPEIAIKWKYGENKVLNFREKDSVFIKKTYEKYLDLATRQVWAPWEVVNGQRSKEEVHKEIKSIIQRKYG